MVNPLLLCIIILIGGAMLGIPCAWYLEVPTWAYFVAPPIAGSGLLTMFLALWNAQDRPRSRTALVVLVCTVTYWLAPFVTVFIARTLTSTDPETAAILFQCRFYIWLVAPPIIASLIMLMHRGMREIETERFYRKHPTIKRPEPRRSISGNVHRSESV